LAEEGIPHHVVIQIPTGICALMWCELAVVVLVDGRLPCHYTRLRRERDASGSEHPLARRPHVQRGHVPCLVEGTILVIVEGAAAKVVRHRWVAIVALHPGLFRVSTAIGETRRCEAECGGAASEV
jgi:hypothetical protein